MNKEQILIRNREYGRKARSKMTDKQKEDSKLWKKNWYKDNRLHVINKSHDNKLKRLYNLSLNEYEVMFKDQKRLCFICNKPEVLKQNNTVKRLAVDHCHTTGKVRKLLCHKCNTALGLMHEDIDNLNKMIKYIKDNKHE